MSGVRADRLRFFARVLLFRLSASALGPVRAPRRARVYRADASLDSRTLLAFSFGGARVPGIRALADGAASSTLVPLFTAAISAAWPGVRRG